MNRRILYIVFVLAATVLMSFVAEKPIPEKEEPVKKEYDRNMLFKFITDTETDKTKVRALEHYKVCPPLRPERFRRRVKMLWGIDIKDYPADAKIWLNNGIKLSIKYQTLDGFDPGEELPFSIPNHPDSIYPVIRRYIFYNDTSACHTLDNYTIKAYNEIVGEDLWIKYKTIDWDIMHFSDFLFILHHSIVFQTPPELFEYIDCHTYYGYNYAICVPVTNPETLYRTSDIRTDRISLYLSEQLKKGREIGIDEIAALHNDDIWLGFGINNDVKSFGRRSAVLLNKLADEFVGIAEWRKANPWRHYDRAKSVSAFQSFLLQLQVSVQNKTVIQYMTGQLDYGFGGECKHGPVRDSIRSNNYYGYAVLREFCENPEREMPTLEKVGTSFKATVKAKSALLYLEPFADSYDIDTLRSDESFVAYEMGHDDYYLVEVEKPVESPVAGPDGYALILDRTETVYGYVKKAEVKEFTDSDLIY